MSSLVIVLHSTRRQDTSLAITNSWSAKTEIDIQGALRVGDVIEISYIELSN